ncbi:MAG: ABC transporter permease [Tissierella sp.]|uniref:ABC transporter permease n=1 Tax=Tissierella sp. TaxID=41274 RepID=UPI003F9CB0A7
MKISILRKIMSNIVRLATLLIAVSIISFILVSFSPIDPVQSYVGAGVSVSPSQRENIEEYWSVDESPVEKFISWSSSILKGDFGISLIYRKPVINIIFERFKLSLLLMGTAWLLSSIIGYILGMIMGIFRGRWIDKILKTTSIVLASTPGFWVGLLLLMVFSIWLKLFPVGLSAPAGVLAEEVTILQRIHHLILPAISLSLTSFANVALHTREKIIHVLQSDYVLFAKARGESKGEIMVNHGIRNTLLPLITLQFASFSELFGGSILVENVFSYPGLGQIAVQAGIKSDIPLLLGVTIFSAFFVFIGNSIANISYEIVDPSTKEGV